MPYKKRYVPKRRKRVYRKRYIKRKKIFKPHKGLSRSIIPFTRERETYFHLSDLTGSATAPFSNFAHTSDGGVVGQLRVQLDDFPSHTDFTNLFRQYKINGLKITLYPSANMVPAGASRDEGGNYGNNQVLIRTMYNKTGIAIGSGNTISEWSQVQAKKQWMLASNKPTVIYCPLSMLTPIAAGDMSAGNEEYAVTRPKYVSTNHADAIFYGLNIRFDSLNGVALSQSDQVWPQFRIVAKVYITCKGVA